MVKLERLELGKLVDTPGLHGKTIELSEVIARGVTNNGLYEIAPSYCGFLQDPNSGTLLFFQWSPYFPGPQQGEDVRKKKEAEASKLVSILKTSSETNTPIDVQGVILDKKKSELAPEEYYLQITGLNLMGYSAGDFIF